ncbi:uncharacterized protein [Montipora capricornis]|uniref:uncharacterized protein isoform X1 n=1 Tax=Montipora capricornis TaxID=246305 RepID=UPI0035F1F22B
MHGIELSSHSLVPSPSQVTPKSFKLPLCFAISKRLQYYKAHYIRDNKQISEMTESLKHILGHRESAKEVLKGETSTSHKRRVADITDSNPISENNTIQTVMPKMPVEQEEQKPKEGQTSDVQTEPKTRDPLCNIGKPSDQFRIEVIEERRSSVPDLRTPGHKQWENIKHYQSEPVLSELKKVEKLKLDDRLYKSVRNNLTLLERIARCLDKEQRHGTMKCWKHLAEQFGVEESIYKTFTSCPENSPTENLFDFLKTRKPTEFTIKKFKEGMNSIDRNDVIEDVFKKHQDLDSLNDKTTVGSLFDSHPLIIGEIAVLLDVNEPGKKNWRQLADWFEVPKSESQNFAESIQDNPTEQLLEYIYRCLNPKMTVGYLQSILKDLKMQEALDVLMNSKKAVTKNTLLKNLWDQDYEAVDNLCNQLNQRYNSRIRSWRRLGHQLGIKNDDLDTFSPNEDEVISPTEALLNHLGGSQVHLTMGDLIWAVASIGRNDALSVLEDYFPEGVVDSFLERKRAPPPETEV